jgi:hypothetical protein
MSTMYMHTDRGAANKALNQSAAPANSALYTYKNRKDR